MAVVDDLFDFSAGPVVASWIRPPALTRPSPEEPLRNISVAAARVALTAVLAPEKPDGRASDCAQTIDAAWQLFAEDAIGSLWVSKYADMVVLSADPRRCRQIDLAVRATPGRSPGLSAVMPCCLPCWTACMRWPCRCSAFPRRHRPLLALIEGPAGWGGIRCVRGYPVRAGVRVVGVGDRGRLLCAPPRFDVTAFRLTPLCRPFAAAQVGRCWPGFLGPDGQVVMSLGRAWPTMTSSVSTRFRELVVPMVRVDANGGWGVAGPVAAAARLTADGPLGDEQPCATVARLLLRRRVDVRRRATRKAGSVGRCRAQAANIAVLKVAPAERYFGTADIGADRHSGGGLRRARFRRRNRRPTDRRRGLPNSTTRAGWAPAKLFERTWPSPQRR